MGFRVSFVLVKRILSMMDGWTVFYGVGGWLKWREYYTTLPTLLY